MLHSEGRLMKGGNAHGTNIERTVGKVDGLVGFLGEPTGDALLEGWSWECLAVWEHSVA
jgi:hypothetical protein